MSSEANDKLFCDIAIDLGYITAEQAGDVLQEQKVDAAVGQQRPVGAYFYEKGNLTKEQIGHIVKMQDRMASSQRSAAPAPSGQLSSPAGQRGPSMAYAAQSPAGISRVVYVVLGLFLGCLGIHNFAAGYAGRGLTQLLITVTLGWFFGVGIIITAIWALLEIATVTEDSNGRPFT